MTYIPEDLTVVFDLDGTLVDTAPDLFLSLNHALRKRRIEPAEYQDVFGYIGFGARRMIEIALEKRAEVRDEAEIDDMLKDFLDYYRKNICVESSVYDGVWACLEKLRSQGANLGVCTNKQEAFAVDLLDQLDMSRYFGAILGADTLSVRKPDPNHLIETITRSGGKPSRSVMIGDSETDIKTAKAANVPVVAVDFGYTPKPVHHYSPDIVISHYDELLGSIHSLHR